MSLGFEKVKIGLEVDGEVKYLNGIEIYEEHGEDRIRYQLTPTPQILTSYGAGIVLHKLHTIEPEKNFLVLDGSKED